MISLWDSSDAKMRLTLLFLLSLPVLPSYAGSDFAPPDDETPAADGLPQFNSSIVGQRFEGDHCTYGCEKGKCWRGCDKESMGRVSNCRHVGSPPGGPTRSRCFTTSWGKAQGQACKACKQDTECGWFLACCGPCSP